MAKNKKYLVSYEDPFKGAFGGVTAKVVSAKNKKEAAKKAGNCARGIVVRETKLEKPPSLVGRLLDW